MSYDQECSSANDKISSSDDSQDLDQSEDKENKYEVYDIKKYYEKRGIDRPFSHKHPRKPCYANASASLSSASYSDEEENMPASFHGSLISKKYIKEDIKPKFSCGCSSCIEFPGDTCTYFSDALALNENKSKKDTKESEDKNCVASTSKCKDSEDNVYVLQVNTPLKRKPPPKGPFPYKERKFFKSGGLLSRSQETGQQVLVGGFEDDSTSSDD